MKSVDTSTAVRALAALDDPTRHALYCLVRAASEPVTREVAAQSVGISRKLAAFHLDKLVEANLLVADFDATARSRQFGRPPKVYRPTREEFRISIPERRPELLAQLLLEAVTTASAKETPTDAALRVARDSGYRLGVETRRRTRSGRLGVERAMALATSILAERGFEPARESASCIRLRNCPYAPMSQQATELVCGINHQHLTGLLKGLAAPTTITAELAPTAGQCCVQLRSS